MVDEERMKKVGDVLFRLRHMYSARKYLVCC